MAIDEAMLVSEKEALKTEFDKLSEDVKQAETKLGQVKANMNAIHGAVQQCDRLLAILKRENEKKENEKV